MRGARLVGFRRAVLLLPLLVSACANNSSQSADNTAGTASPAVPAEEPLTPSAAPPLTPIAGSPATNARPSPIKNVAGSSTAPVPSAKTKDRAVPQAVVPDGLITGYVTSNISIFEPNGKVISRVNRDRVPIPAAGLPFTHIPNSQLVRIVVHEQAMLVDTGEFNATWTKKLVNKTCGSEGKPPMRGSPASMGHGQC